MKKSLFLCILCISTLFCSGQTVDPNAWDGKIYFKVKNNAFLSLPDYNSPGPYNADFMTLIADYGITKIFKPFKLLESIDLSNTYQINFTTIDSVIKLINKLSAFSYIEYAEKVPYEQIFITPGDYSATTQWGLNQIGADNAWNIHPMTLGSFYPTVPNNIVLAIVDNEINTVHQELSNILWTNTGEIPANSIDDDGNGYIDDVNGFDVADTDPVTINSAFNHGTHCAGIACANIDNGTTAMAGLGNCQLMPIKATSNAALPTSITAGWLGIQYAIDNKADVISISWGGSLYSTTYQNMINIAYANGIIVVAAAGNTGSNLAAIPVYPALYNNVITVGSTGRPGLTLPDEISTFSNYGIDIDVMAPGYDIYSSISTGTASYGSLSGTSMATPLVAGLCALMRTYNPYLTPAAIENCIYTTCANINTVGVNTGYSGLLGNGRIDAFQAMQCLYTSSPIISFTSDATVICANGSVQFNNTSGGAPPITGGISWIFTGGTPSSSTSASPLITYNTPGIYPVTLTVTNVNGTVVQTFTNYITVNACTTIVSDQGHWYFGVEGVLNFSSGIGVVVSNGTSINTNEAAASVSNATTGALLFYTDGETAYRSNHVPMIALGGIMNGSPNSSFGSASQGALITPNPANPNQYYIFYVSDRENYGAINFGLQFAIVDMTLAAGFGDFVSINTPVPGINPHTTEHLTAIPDCGTGFWIIVHGTDAPNNDKIYAYHLTGGGLSAPVISNGYITDAFGTLFFPGPFPEWIGNAKVSPDGTKIAFATNTTNTFLYNFNKTTGVLTSAATITTTGPVYGASFSPNSNVLYLTEFNNLIQYDVTNLSTPILAYTTTSFSPTGALRKMQLGPDNRIYVTEPTNKISIMEDPDNLNSALMPNAFDFHLGSLTLPAGSATLTSLPNMIDAKKGIDPFFTYSFTTCNIVAFNSPNCSGHSWNFGDPASGAANTSTLQNPTHTFASAGSYTVTLTIGISTYVQTITILPSVITISGPTPVCENALVPSTYFTGSYAGYTYSWTATTGGIIGASDLFTVDINWTATGVNTATVVVTQSGCTKTASYNVTVYAAPTASAGNDQYVCDVMPSLIGGSPTASGGTPGYTYLWTPSTALTCTTCTNPTANPSVTTTYTVQITDANGCMATDAVDILFDVICVPASGGISYNVPTILSSGTLTGNYAFNADIIISGNVNFDNADISIYTGKKITVQNGATLTIKSSYLHSCINCGAGMWYGIEVQNGGILIMNPLSNHVSLISNATNAIITEANTGATPIPVYNIERTIFNVNNTNIKIQAHPGNFSSNFIRNTIFTSRSGIPTALGSLTTTFTNLKNALITNSVASLTPYPQANILTGGRAKRGVDINGKTLNAVIVGSSSSPANLNIFDYHDYGIFYNNSRVTVYNNTFENFKGFVSGSVPPSAPVGVCIYAPTTNSNTSVLNVGSTGADQQNSFKEFYRGVEVNFGSSVVITSNTFTNGNNSAPVSFTSPINLGDVGIFLKDITTSIYVTDSNKINNCKTGVFISRNSITGGALNPNTISVERNRIYKTGSGIITTGVILQDLSSNTITTPHPITIGDNKLTVVNSGIKFSYIRSRARAFKNAISVNGPGTTTRYGIWLEGCDKAEAKNNTIYNSSGTATTNTAIRGIYANLSTNNKVFCNSITKMGEGMSFEGNCISTYTGAGSPGILSNSLNTCNRGHVLRNTGVIGQQGNAGASANFSWTPATVLGFPGGFTNTQATANANTASKLFGATGTIPATNHQTTFATWEYSYASGGLNNSSATLAMSCPATLASIIAPPGGEGSSAIESLEYETPDDYIPNTKEYTDELVELSKFIDEKSDFALENNWLNRQFVLNETTKHPNLLDLNDELKTLNTAEENQAIISIIEINALIEKGDYSAASFMNSALIETNQLEKNHKVFNAINLKKLLEPLYEFTSDDADELASIANQCPLSGGLAVYQSRNLLNVLYNYALEFNDYCNFSSKSLLVDTSVNSLATIYPNPNNGIFTLGYTLAQDALLVIRNAQGQVLYTFALSKDKAEIKLQCPGIAMGIYNYSIVTDNETLHHGKFVINR